MNILLLFVIHQAYSPVCWFSVSTNLHRWRYSWRDVNKKQYPHSKCYC